MANGTAQPRTFSRGSTVLDYWLAHAEGLTVQPLGARVEEVVVKTARRSRRSADRPLAHDAAAQEDSRRVDRRGRAVGRQPAARRRRSGQRHAYPATFAGAHRRGARRCAAQRPVRADAGQRRCARDRHGHARRVRMGAAESSERGHEDRARLRVARAARRARREGRYDDGRASDARRVRMGAAASSERGHEDRARPRVARAARRARRAGRYDDRRASDAGRRSARRLLRRDRGARDRGGRARRPHTPCSSAGSGRRRRQSAPAIRPSARVGRIVSTR